MKEEHQQFRTELRLVEQTVAAARNQATHRVLRAEDRLESAEAAHQKVIDHLAVQEAELI